MSSRLRIGIGVVAAALAILAVVWFLVLPRLQPHVFYGQVIQSGNPAPSVELLGPGGEPVALTDFEDQVVVMYFGYTFCPDVCPITLAKLDRARTMLGDDAEDVQVVMITVDPERDTVEKLEEYTANFDPSFIGLTGDIDDIDRIATTYGVYYAASETESAAGYLVDHTSTVMVVDRSGELKLIIPFDATDVQIAADLAYLVG